MTYFDYQTTGIVVIIALLIIIIALLIALLKNTNAPQAQM